MVTVSLKPIGGTPGDATAEMLQREILSRLGYLDRVGLGYLDLDRSTRSLSGAPFETGSRSSFIP